MSQDKKREAIIDAALKRFAHFGVAKTTMSEIGADLAISKASLYYYFPDKINLYAAVLQTIIEESQAKDMPVVEREPDPFKAINLYLERRTEQIIKYHNIIEFIRSRADIPEELKPVFENVKEREQKAIKSIVDKGVKVGVFVTSKPGEKALLLANCLEGLRHISLKQTPSFFPDKVQFQAILKQEKDLAQTFLKGLTK